MNISGETEVQAEELYTGDDIDGQWGRTVSSVCFQEMLITEKKVLDMFLATSRSGAKNNSE